MKFKQFGFINFGSMTLLIGGLALAGLLVYGLSSGHELPLWPALAVALVNLVGAGKLVYDARQARRQKAAAASQVAPAGSGPSEKAPRR